MKRVIWMIMDYHTIPVSAPAFVSNDKNDTCTKRRDIKYLRPTNVNDVCKTRPAHALGVHNTGFWLGLGFTV